MEHLRKDFAHESVPRWNMHSKSGRYLLISSWGWRGRVSTIVLCFYGLLILSSAMGSAFAADPDPPPTVGIANPGSVAFSPSETRTISSCTKLHMVNGKKTTECKGYTTIPTDIPDHNEINVLDMSTGNNNLQMLTDGQLSKGNLPALNNLTLVNCQIFTIERGAFKGGENLQTLDLRNNRIEVLDPQVFAELINLRYLYLSGNPINRFHTVFPPMRALYNLDLSSCVLDTVPVGAFQKLENLEKLYLNNNQLKNLDWRVISNVRVLHTVDLTDNPWHCDCHVKFLIDILREKSIIFQGVTCATSPSSAVGVRWEEVNQELLTCHPEIKELSYKSYDAPGTKSDESNDIDQNSKTMSKQDGQASLGQDVYFECMYSGFPQPEIKWLKDNKQIVQPNKYESARALPVSQEKGGGNSANSDDSSTAVSSPQMADHGKPRIEFHNSTIEILTGKNINEQSRNYNFSHTLRIRRLQPEDVGYYECRVSNLAGFKSKTVYLNITLPYGDDGLVVGGISGKKGLKVWMWILIALLCVLILILAFLLVCMAWRRRAKEKHEEFRKVVHEKFKDSNVDLGEFIDMKTTSPQRSQNSNGINRSEGATPLLDNKSENSTVIMSMLSEQQHPLPDIAVGNAELIRNSQIFSPKPPPPALHSGYPVDSRKEFFARQISEPYLRPGSAMSLTRPMALNAAQRNYILAQQGFQSEPVPYPGQEPMYEVPGQIRTLPRSGSAMSMSALPENDLRRQLFLRQYSQPSYATAARLPRRNPSVSSEPPQQDMMPVGAFNYSTLPRRPMRLQNWSRPVSPTNSTCSSYSTLSWRPASVNPVTGVVYDGVGPRTTADGGSSLSLNKILDLDGTDNVTPPLNGGGKVKSVRNPRLGHSRTPSSLTRGHNDFFSFEPIQEVESSECASNLQLDKLGGRQTPSGYTTQSLARGEPRYKKKKPPPIAVIPTKLKEPSRAFEHLKGRSVSPAARTSTSDINGVPEKGNSEANNSIVSNGGVNGNNDNTGNSVSILESTIDEEILTPTPTSKLPSKPAPPPPPPKPKRIQTPDGDNEEGTTVDSGGTVV